MGLQESENIRVVVRVRPLTKDERQQGDEEHISCVGERSLQVMDTKQAPGRAQTGTAFQFGRVFGPETTQDFLFANSGIASLLDHVLEGYSATVFAYGPTGSGKTFSITGRPDSIVKHGSGDATDGIVIRAVEALYIKVRLQAPSFQPFLSKSPLTIFGPVAGDWLGEGHRPGAEHCTTSGPRTSRGWGAVLPAFCPR